MPDQLADFKNHILDGADALMPEVDIQFRKMFGGMGAYAGGRFFAATFGGGFSLKFGPQERERRLKMLREGALISASEELGKNYVAVPMSVRQDREQLREWVEASIAYVQSLPAPKPKKKNTP